MGRERVGGEGAGRGSEIATAGDVERRGVMGTVATKAGTATMTRGVVAWALYDLANTIFSFSILTIYFPLWIVDDMGGRDGTYGLANSISMALVFLSAPFAGTLSDQVPRRIPFLAATAAVCGVCTALIGSVPLAPSLVFFVVANYAFQIGVIFYDTLLPSVSTEENRGRVGGFAIGFGYFGTVIALGMGSFVLWQFGDKADPLVFKLTALLFVLFGVPCFLWVPERRRADARPVGRETLRKTVHELRATISRARGYPGLSRFLIGRVFYADAANTLVAFVGIYATKEIGLTEGEVRILVGVSVVCAALGALTWGRIVDHVGSRRTLGFVLWLWGAVLGITALIAYLDLPKGVFYAIVPVSGVAFSGIAASDRPLLFRLSPPRYAGQLYGLFAMTGRFASIIGPLLWTIVVDGLHLGRPAAILGLLGMIAISYVILRPLNDDRRQWTAEEAMPVS
jgi:UMF1 family MFS transporter